MICIKFTFLSVQEMSPLFQSIYYTCFDLVGGYYDAGDHVKFGFPMAYTVTMLSWGVLEFEKEMVAADQLNRALDAIRWGTNYFLKAHTQPNVLWVQVKLHLPISPAQLSLADSTASHFFFSGG